MPPKAPVQATQAAPPLISLLSSADIVPEKERWEAGFSREPETCGTGSIGAVDPCEVHEKGVDTGAGSIDVEPFLIYAGDKCSAFGFAARQWQDRANRKLQACESRLIEAELWSGTLARAATPDWPNKYFTQISGDVVAQDAEPLDAFACLEQYLFDCNCGGRGMIHATPQLVSIWSSLSLISREVVNNRTRLVSKLGTIVVPGSGYDGSGPQLDDGGAPTPAVSGSVWAYATSMIEIRLSPITTIPGSLSEATDRQTNTVTYIAERTVAATWDCCLGAAEVNIALCEVGGAGS